jgi:methylated-DNA-protein-cysteine methyltransferase-like protein
MGEAGRRSFFDRVYDVVRQVPHGRVTTYGDVSRALTGTARSARTVGWALHGLPWEMLETVPWWRVVNARGRISTSCQQHPATEQRRRLEDEGVAFGDDERIDLERFGWDAEHPGDVM